jgi:hypothetical protein
MLQINALMSVELMLCQVCLSGVNAGLLDTGQTPLSQRVQASVPDAVAG